MDTVNIRWAFYLSYNHLLEELILHPSEICRQNYMTEHEIRLNLDQMKLWIHKYDFRKFNYFAKQSFKQPFDTTIRIKCEQIKGYLRTQAICQTTPEGFKCVLIEDKLFHQLSKTWNLDKPNETKLSWYDPQLYHFETMKHLNLMKKHLQQMMQRETI